MSARNVIEHALRSYYADSADPKGTVERLLAQYDAERDEEKASATAPTATPAEPTGRVHARNRLDLLRRTATQWQGEWTTSRAAHLYSGTYGPGTNWRSVARRDLAQLCREGLLVEHDEEPTRHHYTFNSRKGGRP